MVCPPPYTGNLEELFRHEVLKMFKAEGKITDCIIENMMNWPPARRAYASESTTADSMRIAAKPSGRTGRLIVEKQGLKLLDEDIE